MTILTQYLLIKRVSFYRTLLLFTAIFFSISVSGVAVKDKSAKILKVWANPNPPRGTGASRCEPGALTISARGAVGDTIKWFNASTGGASLSTGGSFTIPNISTTTSYFAEARNVSGVSTRTEVIAKVSNLSIDFTFDNNSACSLTEINFTPTINGGDAPYSYTWNFGDAQTSTDVIAKHKFLSEGCGTTNFSVYLTVKDKNGCEKTVFKPVNVKQVPLAALTDVNNPIFNSFKNCANSPTTANPNFTITVENTSADICATGYTLDWGDGSPIETNYPKGATLTHTYTTLGAFNLVITATGINGCVNKKTYVVANQTNPAGSLGTLGSTTNLCAPATIPFTISNWQLNSPGTIYILNFGDGTSQTLTHPLNATNTDHIISYTYTKSSCPFNSYTAILQVINACDQTPYTAGNIQIRLKPEADFEADQDPGCVGTAIKFSDKTKKGSTGGNCSNQTLYSWDFGDPASGANNTSTIEEPSHTFSAAGEYTVTLTTTNPCGASTVSKTICITDPPAPAFILDKSEVCLGGVVETTNQTVSSSTCSTIKYNWSVDYTASNCSNQSGWSFENGTDANSFSPSFKFTKAGTYTIKLEATNECGTFPTTKTVTVTQPPQVSLNPAQESCGPLTYNPIATVTNCGTATPTYAWTFTGGTPATSTAADPGNITFATTGTHTISLVVTNECGVSNTATQQVIIRDNPTVNTIASQIFCGGDNTGPFNFTGAVPNTVYTWVNDNPAIGLPASGTGNIQAFLIQNNTPAPITANITATPRIGNCTGTPQTFTLTVNPQTTPANAGADAVLCDVSYQQNGNFINIGTPAWTQTEGPATTFADPALFNTAVNGLQKGNQYKFQWSVAGACNPTNDEVTVNVLSDIVSTIKQDLPSICAGDAVNLSTDALSGGSTNALAASYAHTWEFSSDGINWQVLSGNENIQVNPIATTSYRRKTTSRGICEVISNVITVTVHSAIPNAVAGSNAEVCNATSYQLAGNDPGAGFTGTWTAVSGGNVTFSPNADAYNATATGLIPGNVYVFKWTITNTLCTPKTSEVTVSNLLPLTNTINAAITEICSGQAISIVGSLPSGGNNSYQYQWLLSTDNVNWLPMVNETGKDLNVVLTTTCAIKRVVTSSACSSESTPVNFTVQPPISNNTISTNQEICTGLQPALITGTSPQGADGVYDYIWQESTDQVNWTNVAGEGSKDFEPPILTSTMYYRRVVLSTLCTGPQSNISNSITIKVNPDSKAEFTSAFTKGCVPFDLATVIQPGVYPDRNSIYRWFANGVSIGTGATFPGYTINTDDATVTIRLITESPFGCKSDTTETIFITVKNVTASFTKNKTKECGPFTVNFTNTSLPLNDATYEWDFGNGQTSNKIQPDPVLFQPHPLSRDTTYKITLKAFTNCQTKYFTDSVIVRPKAKAIVSPDKTSGCSPFTVNFTNQSRGMPNTYKIDFGDGSPILTKTDNTLFTHTYTTAVTDTISVKLVAENECGIDSTIYKIVVFPNTVLPELVVNGNAKFGCAPFTASFSNNSTGANRFVWDFGDNTTFVTTAAPEVQTHTFTQPGVYTITLLASNGCSDTTTTETVTVLAQPVAAFSTFKTQYCVNDSVKFVNETVGGSAFVWEFGDNTTSNEPNPIHLFAQAGVYKVKLKSIQSYNDGTNCISEIIKEIEILPPPIAAFITNETTVNCAPFTLDVTASRLNASNVEWFFGDTPSTNNTAVGFFAKHTFKNPGTYRIKALAYNQSGCIDSIFQLIKVTESPKADFTTVDSVICGNTASAQFNNTTTYGGTDLVSYRWLINNTQVSTQKDLNYAFTVPTAEILPYTFEIKLIAQSTLGCSDTAKFNLKFNPLPKAVFTTVETIACPPFGVRINNTSAYSDEFKWYLDGALVSTQKEPLNIILDKSETQYRLKLVVSNIYNCSIDSIEKTLSTQPKPEAAFTLRDSISCNGKLDLQVTNTTTGATTYKWDFGDNTPVSTQRTPTHTYGVPGTYNLTIIAYGTLCSDTLVKQIKISSPPNAAFKASATTGCTKVTATFENLSDNASTYLWDFGDGTFSTESNPTHNFTFLQSPYTIKLIAIGENGCADTTVTLNYITVTTPPTAEFTVLPDSVIKIPHKTFNFKNLSSEDAINFKWEFGDGKVSEIKNPEYTYADTGSYVVKLISFNKEGCSDTLTRNVRVDGFPGYLFIPNAFEPANPQLHLKTFLVKASGLKEFKMKIFNKWGNLVWQSHKLNENGEPLESWDGYMNGEPAPQGVYIWDISARFIDGNEWKGMKYEKGKPKHTGTVHLIR